MAYEVKLFYNTGFNPSNVPDSPALIQSAGSGVFEGTPLLQNRFIGTVKIKVDDFNAIKNVDYCQIGDEFYFVNNITMEAPKTATLSLVHDIIGSIGIANINVLGGWAVRRHYTSSEDTFGANTLQEPFLPAEPPQMEFEENIFGLADSKTQGILVTTVALTNVLNYVAREYKTANGDKVIVPALGGLQSGALIDMYTPAGMETMRLPNMAIYQAEGVTDEVAAVRELGVESAIVGSYLVPNELFNITVGPGSGGGLAGIYNSTKSVNIDYNAEYATVENKKALALYNTVVLTNISSGASAEYNATDLTNSGSISVELWADLSPNGCTYARPSVYKGNTTDVWTGAVKGANWQNNQINFNFNSGVAVTHHNLYKQYQNLQANTNATLEFNKQMYDWKYNPVNQGVMGLQKALGQVGNISSGNYMGVGSDVLDAGKMAFLTPQEDAMKYNYQQATINREFAQTVNSILQTYSNEWLNADVIYPYSASLQSYYNNDFNITAVHLSENDVIRFDRFLHNFGYAVSEPLQKSFMTNRSKFNYIQTSDAQIKCGKGVFYNEAIANILNGGVRIWHVLPSAGAYAIGGNS